MSLNIFAKAKSFIGQKFVKSALSLFVCVFICKILGLIYRIPLTTIIGAEGVGIYQLIFPLYSFLLILSSNAVPLALSKMIAEKIKVGNLVYVSKLKRIAFIFFFVLGTFFSILLICFSKEISMLQGNTSATLGYYFIAPSVVIVSIIAVFRGILQAEKKILPTGISQILEQVFKFGFGIILPLYFAHYGLEFQVAMCLLSVTLSEIIALIYLILSYLFKRKRNKIREKENYTEDYDDLPNIIEWQNKNRVSNYEIFKDLIKNIFPILLSNLIVPFSVLIESFFIINTLTFLGVSVSLSTAIYGAYSGIICTLINAPVTLISSIGSILVPYVAGKNNSCFSSYSKLKSNHFDCSSEISIQMPLNLSSKKQINKNIAIKKKDLYLLKSHALDKDKKELYISFKLAILIAVPCVFIYMLFSFFIIPILFPLLNGEILSLSIAMLSISSINVISLSFPYIISSYLQSIGQAYVPVKCFFIFNILRLLLCFLSLIKFGMIGFVIANVFANLCQCLQFIMILKNNN